MIIDKFLFFFLFFFNLNLQANEEIIAIIEEAKAFEEQEDISKKINHIKQTWINNPLSALKYFCEIFDKILSYKNLHNEAAFLLCDILENIEVSQLEEFKDTCHTIKFLVKKAKDNALFISILFQKTPVLMTDDFQFLLIFENLKYIYLRDQNAENINGIEKFKNLKTLIISKMSRLKKLYLEFPELTKLLVNSSVDILSLDCPKLFYLNLRASKNFTISQFNSKKRFKDLNIMVPRGYIWPKHNQEMLEHIEGYKLSFY